MDEVTERLFGPQSMSESAELIREKIVGQAEGEPIILMAHNGPQGLGSRRHDPCGKDFRPTEGKQLSSSKSGLPVSNPAGSCVAGLCNLSTTLSMIFRQCVLLAFSLRV